MSLLLLSFWHFGGSLTIALIVAQLVVFAVLVVLNDWYFKHREAQRQSRIRELEALFSLPDTRSSTSSGRNIRS